MNLRLACLLATLTFAATAADLQLTETDALIKVTLGEKPVLEYIKTAKPVPEGIEAHYSRSGYIHPVFNPAGQAVTGDYPLDHANQHALFFAWTKATYDGKKVDFWNQAKQLGSVEHRGVTALKREPERVSFAVQQAFIAGSGAKAKDILIETWTVTVHKTDGDSFLFDIESAQECVTDKPLTLEKYHYGGMALRLNVAWYKEKGDHSVNPGDLRYLTSDGKDRWEGNHSRPNWVAMHGKLDGKDTSMAVFCSPDNFRAPQHVRIHPDKPYFCFAPMVEGKFQITPGTTYVSKYRYLVTSAALDKALIDTHWQAYARGE
jgi:hypothetical protein